MFCSIQGKKKKKKTTKNLSLSLSPPLQDQQLKVNKSPQKSKQNHFLWAVLFSSAFIYLYGARQINPQLL